MPTHNHPAGLKCGLNCLEYGLSEYLSQPPPPPAVFDNASGDEPPEWFVPTLEKAQAVDRGNAIGDEPWNSFQDYGAVNNMAADLQLRRAAMSLEGPLLLSREEVLKVMSPTGGAKADGSKLPMGLLPTKALRAISAVLQFGQRKYDAHNWRKGLEWQRVIDASYRHLTAFNDGEDNDPETGLSHLAHLGCCVLFLLEYQTTHPELDNRYKGD